MDVKNSQQQMKPDYDKLLEIVRSHGMDYKWAKMFISKLSRNESDFSVDEKTKIWALERGFYPGRVELFGLTEENYKDYMPDYSYFMIHPLNHHFRKWLDKLTLKYVLNSNGCEDSMPEYYLYIENNGNYTYLMDLDENIKKDENIILNLLKSKGILAIKPNSGTSGGLGFLKTEYKNNRIYINNKAISMEQFNEIIRNLGNNIVTEYCIQHSELAKIWSLSECTLRVNMMKLPYENHWDEPVWKCLLSFARFGSSISGGASNLTAGGAAVGFNFETGECFARGTRNPEFLEEGEKWCYEHPDTHIKWKGFKLPNWEYVREKLLTVCKHVSSLDYLGFDVIITEDGMKICEINSHPALDGVQLMGNPALSTCEARRFFEYHGLYEVDNKNFLEAYKQSLK